MPYSPRNDDQQATVGTTDPVELAIEATNEGTPGRAAAYTLLDRQARLIGWQIAGERMSVALKVLGGLVGLVAALLLGSMIYNAARSKAVVVQALESPPALVERGLSGRVVAGKLQDGLTLIQTTIRSGGEGRSIANAWTGDIALEVPETGISIGEIDRLLRERLGHNTYISGEITQTPGGQIALTVRGGAILARTFIGSPDALDDLIRRAAEYIFGEAEPERFAGYLGQLGRSAEVITFSTQALGKADVSMRSQFANSLGLAYSDIGPPELAVEWYRRAILFDPNNWVAHGNLIGGLMEPGLEEQAYQAADRMVRSSERLGDRGPNSSELGNAFLLKQDWKAYVEGALADAKETGGTGSDQWTTANVQIAEGEAHRHDWSTAGQYLALASSADQIAIATGNLIQGYRAVEESRYAEAVRRLEAFDAAWLTDNGLAYVYYDGPCWLGLAYDLTGQRAKAQAVYNRMGAFYLCYAFQADGVEATGDRAAADAAYRRAITLAPSIPFAYQRRALALMQRGEFKMAAGRFRDAHDRGPNWADPLKGWGDALAAQGKWAMAVDKYEQAEPLAPNWRELHLAHAVALERLGRFRKAASQRKRANGT
jgi:tetratricopeptide (TPR) repeat protein